MTRLFGSNSTSRRLAHSILGLSILIGATFASQPTAHAIQQVTINEISYQLEVDGQRSWATASGYDGDLGGKVKLPPSITANGRNYPVTAVADYTFSDQGLTQVELPPQITRIGEYAFAGNQLKQITLPPALERIDEGAFAENEPTGLDFPASLRSSSRHAFEDNRLSAVAFNQRLEVVGEYAFQRNQLAELTSLTASGRWGLGPSARTRSASSSFRPRSPR